MHDRFEVNLARELTAYADARIRPIDAMQVATEVVASAARQPARVALSIWPMPVRTRWFVLAAAATLAVLVGVLSGIGRSHQVTVQPTALPRATSTPAATSDAGVDLRPTILRAANWGLDFAASSLDAQADPELGYTLGSGIAFADDRFSGGTGSGGGCDSFAGTFSIHESELRLTFDRLRQGCGQGSPQQIIERLVGTRRFVLTECSGPVVEASSGTSTVCETLTLIPDRGIGLLIYRRSR
jgi:hypothetical protein